MSKRSAASFWPEVAICTVMWNTSFFMAHKTTSLFILGLATMSLLVYSHMVAKIWLWCAQPLRCAMLAGLAWGAGCFGVQTLWAADVCTRFSNHFGCKGLLLCGGAFVMFTLVGGIFTVLAVLLCAAIDSLMTGAIQIEWETPRYFVLVFLALLFSPLLFTYLDRISLWPSMTVQGYPFFSPLIPLSSSSEFIDFVEKVRGHNNSVGPGRPNFHFHWIEPKAYKKNLQENKGKTFNPKVAGDQITKGIETSVQSFASEKNSGSRLVLLAPESSFPFKINEYPEITAQWRSKLKKGQIFALGTYRSEQDRIFQTTCMMDNSGITRFLDKKRLTPFAESKFSTSGDSGPNKAQIDENLTLVPLVCFEFFIDGSSINNAQLPNEFPVIFANDSWFPYYFKTLLRNQARLSAAWYGKKIFYLSHFFDLCISPFSGTLTAVDWH